MTSAVQVAVISDLHQSHGCPWNEPRRPEPHGPPRPSTPMQPLEWLLLLRNIPVLTGRRDSPILSQSAACIEEVCLLSLCQCASSSAGRRSRSALLLFSSAPDRHVGSDRGCCCCCCCPTIIWGSATDECRRVGC